MSRVVGVDVGGTFTDVVVLDGQSVVGRKVRTTLDQSDGVAQALSGWIDDATTILHGTTAGTNALIEGRGATTALVTTRGFEDLRDRPSGRPSLYDPFVDRPVALSLEVCELDTRATSRPSAPWSSRPTPKLWRWLWFGPTWIHPRRSIWARGCRTWSMSRSRWAPGVAPVPGIRAHRHHRPQCLFDTGAGRISVQSRSQGGGGRRLA